MDEIVPADMILLEVVHPNHECNVDESSITGVYDKFKFKKAFLWFFLHIRWN